MQPAGQARNSKDRNNGSNTMKRFVIIGLGGFGSWVARALHEAGHEVIAIDRDGDKADGLAPEVTRSVVGDGTDPEVLRRVGAEGADAAVVSTGDDPASTILAVLALREIGVAKVYAKASSPRWMDALERFDLEDIVFPEREAAQRLAHRLTSTAILDYVPLGPGYAIQELAIPDPWVGKTLAELALPLRHSIQIVAILDLLSGDWTVPPKADEPLKESDVAVVAGKDQALTDLVHKSTKR